MILLVIKNCFHPSSQIGVLFGVLFKFSLPTVITRRMEHGIQYIEALGELESVIEGS
jgi:hypothetical protein